MGYFFLVNWVYVLILLVTVDQFHTRINLQAILYSGVHWGVGLEMNSNKNSSDISTHEF
jgi:hypothetical protein